MSKQFVKPDWDSYFMAMAFVVCQRSIDPDTKHGCVVVDKDHSILSIGYNSPPRGCVDEEIPLTRPEKYSFFEHAESNAIINAARVGIPLIGSTFYVTGHPCTKCFSQILNVGAKRIIYGPVKSPSVNEQRFKEIEILMKNQDLILEEYDQSNLNIKFLLIDSFLYFCDREGREETKISNVEIEE